MTDRLSLYDDPELYDAQYRGYRDDLPYYRDLAVRHGGPILELGCGTGRVTLELARAGAEVVAVDRSAAMLEAARRRLAEAGLESAVTAVEADMRHLDLDLELGARFALVVAPFNTLMHAATLDDQDAVLGVARRHLARGGAFACDCYVPDFGGMGVLRHEATWDGVGGSEADLFVLQHHDPLRQRVESRYFLDRIGPDGRLRRERRHVVQRYFGRYELERAVRHAGFADVQVFGGFHRTPVRDDSRVYVVEATV